MRTFVVGYIHGACKALKQVLDRSHFDPETDRLISLGDICDGWSQTKETIDFLLALPHRILIRGNHEVWTLEWMKTGQARKGHLSQGGKATLESYKKGIPQEHVHFLESASSFFQDDLNQLYIHAGFTPDVPLEQQNEELFYWDRALFKAGQNLRENFQIREYRRIFIGHTPTLKVDPNAHPVIWGNLVCLDQGAGCDGKLTLMDADTLDYWQSDWVYTLYPDEPGRKYS